MQSLASNLGNQQRREREGLRGAWKGHLQQDNKREAPRAEFHGVLAMLGRQQVGCLCVCVGVGPESSNHLCLLSSSHRNSRLQAEEDCGSGDPNVLHPRHHSAPWNRLLSPQLARAPAGHHAAQLSLPPLLLVMWFWILSCLYLFLKM